MVDWSSYNSFLHELIKLLECPVCFETFEQPKALWCGHALCQKCIFRLSASNGLLHCPLCRESTRIPRKGLSSVFVVQDMIHLYNKEVESHKYVAKILPILANNVMPSLQVPPSTTHKEDVTVEALVDRLPVVKSYINCKECSSSRIVEDGWICIDCDYLAMCSRCAMLSHQSHVVCLYADLVERRKRAICKWRDIVAASLDVVYKNRMDVEYNETRIRWLNLQVDAQQVGDCEKSDLMKFNETASSCEEVVCSKTVQVKEKFTALRDRLVYIRNEAFLVTADEKFESELRDIPALVRELQDEQEMLLNTQKMLIEALTEKQAPKSTSEPNAAVLCEKVRIPVTTPVQGVRSDQRQCDTRFRRPYNMRYNSQRAPMVNHNRGGGSSTTSRTGLFR